MRSEGVRGLLSDVGGHGAALAGVPQEGLPGAARGLVQKGQLLVAVGGAMPEVACGKRCSNGSAQDLTQQVQPKLLLWGAQEHHGGSDDAGRIHSGSRVQAARLPKHPHRQPQRQRRQRPVARLCEVAGESHIHQDSRQHQFPTKELNVRHCTRVEAAWCAEGIVAHMQAWYQQSLQQRPHYRTCDLGNDISSGLDPVQVVANRRCHCKGWIKMTSRDMLCGIQQHGVR
mmetsp:Transcript_19068/g.57613  ORF Transcript_19068/g.57613 Transcript_19068/m.57613 type:complete len:229 (-) Transcript_19068:288-974(-)